MRIIAGKQGGMPILSPRDETTRPLPDRVKAALFSILGGTLPPRVVVDIFAGTGSFGLEALSRGACRCVFFERDRDAVRRLRTNLEKTGLADRAVVVPGDAFRAALPPAGTEPGEAVVISLDPPYPVLAPGKLREEFRKLLVRLAQSGWPAADALLIVRHERRITVPLEGVPWEPADVRTYGGMTLTFLRRPGTIAAGASEPAAIPEEPPSP
jgi:16S rRNA (guanine966-N2)-methyltransferase